jgi:hypothetical protein
MVFRHKFCDTAEGEKGKRLPALTLTEGQVTVPRCRSDDHDEPDLIQP